MARAAGLSVRIKLTLSYAGFLMLAGALLLATVWVFLLRYVPEAPAVQPSIGHHELPFLGSPSRDDLLRAFTPKAAEVLACLLTFGLLGGWILAGRVLAPLTRITDAARMAGTGSLSHRIRMTGRQDEFRELSDTFDSMLDQIESHVTEQQRFAANASHELRTPLAISQTLLDVARKDPTRDRDEVIERLYTVNKRAIDLTEALLVLSRGDRGNFTRESIDLSLIAEEATETLLPLAENRRVTLDVTGDAARTSGSAELLLRMVTNLVQNAILYNLPAGGTVTVRSEAYADRCVLRIENTGHLLAPDLVLTFAEPFQRGTQRVRSDEHVGAGLGLTIARSIVRVHNGILDVAPGPNGGLLVTVQLPSRP